MKKLISMIMIVCITCSILGTAVFAKEDNSKQTISFTSEDVFALEKYISVDEDGYFEIDEKAAKKDGINTELVNGQKKYFKELNSMIKEGKLQADKNLEIVSLNEDTSLMASHWYSCGGGRTTSVAYHWWGYSRYTCDCLTQQIAADFNSCASVAGGVGVIGAYFGPIGALPGGLSCSYWWLLASRLDANNHGRGVYIEMTWVLAFNITPQ